METKSRTRAGRWTSGSSGNPDGRPVGSRNQATVAMESLLEGDAKRLTQKVLDLALGGDLTALRLCLERLMPPRRDRSISSSLPLIQTAQQISQAMTTVVAAISEGQITPGEGEVLAGILSVQAEVVATADLEHRVEALEKLQNACPEG